MLFRVPQALSVRSLVQVSSACLSHLYLVTESLQNLLKMQLFL